MGSKNKQNKFTFQTGKIGRIPSKHNGSEKKSYKLFLKEFGLIIDEKLREEDRGKHDGSVYVFVMQLLKAERDFKHCDVDNMVKPVIEIFKGKCYEDDGQVTSLLIAKEIQEKPIDDFYFIGIKYLGKDNDPGRLHNEGFYEAKLLYDKVSRYTPKNHA